jgi:chromosome segregation ATPase
MSSDPTTERPDPLRRWQIAVAVLAVLSVTLLLITVILRTRADAAVEERDEAVARAETAGADVAQLQRRNEQLLTQLSTSNERLTELTGQFTSQQLAAADRDVRRQVAAQQAAERAATRPRAGVRAQTAALRAQLRNAQTCAAGTLLAMSQIHAGADVESGSDEAAATLESVLPACRAGLD